MKVIPLPQDGNFAGIVIEPGEHLILKARHPLRAEFAAKLNERVSQSLPGVKVLVVDESFDVYALSREADNPEAHLPGVTAVRHGASGSLERRSFAIKDIRVVREEGKAPKIIGYAAVFNSESLPLTTDKGKRFIETIAPGAFAKALGDGRDILALVGHQPNQVVSRKSAGKLTLREDENGLAFEAIPPDTQRARDLMTDIDHGNIKGMSFGMGDDNKEAPMKLGGDGIPRRTLTEVDLREISFTPIPAYEETSVGLRSANAALEELEKREHPGDYSVVASRCRSAGSYCRQMAEHMMSVRDTLDEMSADPTTDERKHMQDLHDAMGDLMGRMDDVHSRTRSLLGLEDDDEDEDEENENERAATAVKVARYARGTGLTTAQVEAVLGVRAVRSSSLRAGHMTHSDSGPSLNTDAVTYAKSLIAAGNTEDGEWSFGAADEDALLGDQKWDEYGRWFLGRDKNADEKSKGAYKYPFGKGGKVYRRALAAIRSRASQQSAKPIFDAAGELLKLMDEKKKAD